MRGKPSIQPIIAVTAGSIPAGAGKTHFHDPGSPVPVVYPRGCGENRLFRDDRTNSRGLSPRVRGKPAPKTTAVATIGSIPAGAGKTSPTTSGAAPGAVYPRGCGENNNRIPARLGWAGLSPRVRGKHHRPLRVQLQARSIPAGAGKTTTVSLPVWGGQVYPRGCGENFFSARICSMSAGLSPRVRGKRSNPTKCFCRIRSIPAGAGKTKAWAPWPTTRGVYPRGCGENS